MITTDALSARQRDALAALLTAVTEHDGISPLDEAGRLSLEGADATHLLVTDGQDPEAEVVGYAGLLADGTVQGMVRPSHRRCGHGSALLAAVLALRPDAGVWAHGALPEAVAMLEGRGLRRERLLLVLRRPLDAAHPLPAVRTSDLPDLERSSFVAERDAEDWVALNALAFASHPEQGAMSLADLGRRTAEPWFDPEDLLLARRGGELVGFVWLKREGAPAEPEVYVVATAPSVQGHGVAGQLLGEALRRLADAGEDSVLLYVEGDNTSALALYERWGFVEAGRHLQLRAVSEA